MRLKLLILFVFISLSGYSQNLVLNPSFEDTLTIPCSLQVFPQLHCSFWFMPTNGSVDYYSTDYCGGSNVPTNVWGFQYARTGNSYCGLCTFGSINFPNSREYLEGQLIDTLKQGHTYCVSFYVVNTNNGVYYTENIGIYFSNDSLIDYNSSSNLPVIPQVVNTSGIIYDTLNWIQINGTDVAGGGEFITIGNFNNDVNTSLDSNTNINLAFAVAYYYIDDVSVVDCTVGINELENYQLQFFISPNPVDYELRIKYEFTNATLEITDVLGNVMLVENVNPKEKNITINVSNFAKGVYFVKVFSDKGIAVKKFIKE